MDSIAERTAADRPKLLEPHFDRMPAALRTLPRRWAPWRAEWNERRGKYDKIPVHPVSLRGVSTHSEWWSFEDAVAGYEQSLGFAAGIGLNLTRLEGFTGVDLDRCVHDGVLDPWAREVVNRAMSYAELSPSGAGVRIFVRGAASRDWTNNARGVEVYAGHAARFLTLTGHHIEGTPDEVR